MLRRLLPLLPLPFVFALGAWTSARAAERAGADAARVLSVVAVLARAGDAQATAPEAAPEPELIPAQYMVPVELAAPVGKSRSASKKARPSATPVVFVSQKTVLGLANAGARPHGVLVAANGVRPAGLRLTGVGALGIGMQDGDVLTRALGQPVTATGAIVQAVLVARAHHAAVLEGEFWRGAQRYIIRVEQPYVESDAPKQ